MTRAALVWGGAAAAILGLGGLALAVVIVTTATPADHVQRYLDALARDDLATAARLAGLEPPTAMPLGDAGEPGIHRIISTETAPDGVVTVIAEYGDEQDAVRVPFRLEPAPPTLGLVPAWAFVRPPVGEIEVVADQHDRLVVNDRALRTPGAGEAVQVIAFVPARVTVSLAEPLLRAESVTTRVAASGGRIVLAVRPSERLERTVRRELEEVLLACTEQRVLQPAGCPFGIEVVDRVIEPPVWGLDDALDLIIEPGDEPGVWRVRGEGSVQFTVTLQRLFDGVLVERDEPLGFVVRGDVVLEPEGPVLTVYPPEG